MIRWIHLWLGCCNACQNIHNTRINNDLECKADDSSPHLITSHVSWHRQWHCLLKPRNSVTCVRVEDEVSLASEVRNWTWIFSSFLSRLVRVCVKWRSGCFTVKNSPFINMFINSLVINWASWFEERGLELIYITERKQLR